jgi:hypothetical protein
MNKCFSLVMLSFFVLQVSFAQNFEQIEWQGKKVPAISVDVYQNEAVTEVAIKEYFEKMGYNAKSAKGIYSYKGIRLKDIDAKTNYDVLIKVDRKSRQEKDASVVYMSMAKDYDNYIRSSSDDETIENLRKFVSNFQNLANEKALENEIKSQEEKTKSAEKKLAALKEEKTSIETKIKKLEEKKEENIKEIEKQEQEVENQTKALKILLEKRKGKI